MKASLPPLALLVLMLNLLVTNGSSTMNIDVASIEFQRVVFNKSPTLMAQDIVARCDVKEVVKDVDVNGRYEAILYSIERDGHRAWVIIGRVFELNGKTGSWDFIEVRSTLNATIVVRDEVKFFHERNLISISESEVEKRLVRGLSVSSRLNIRLPVPEGYFPNEGYRQVSNITETSLIPVTPPGMEQTSANEPPQTTLYTPVGETGGTGARGVSGGLNAIVISFAISVILSTAAYFITKRIV